MSEKILREGRVFSSVRETIALLLNGFLSPHKYVIFLAEREVVHAAFYERIPRGSQVFHFTSDQTHPSLL